jgi:aspartate-semialdehyde dehydrogenase
MADDTIVTFGPGGYDPSKPDSNVRSVEQVPVPLDEANRRVIETRGRQALEANATFLALPNPTNAQNAAQVKALTRQVNGVIRLVLGALDGTD